MGAITMLSVGRRVVRGLPRGLVPVPISYGGGGNGVWRRSFSTDTFSQNEPNNDKKKLKEIEWKLTLKNISNMNEDEKEALQTDIYNLLTSENFQFPNRLMRLVDSAYLQSDIIQDEQLVQIIEKRAMLYIGNELLFKWKLRELSLDSIDTKTLTGLNNAVFNLYIQFKYECDNGASNDASFDASFRKLMNLNWSILKEEIALTESTSNDIILMLSYFQPFYCTLSLENLELLKGVLEGLHQNNTLVMEQNESCNDLLKRHNKVLVEQIKIIQILLDQY
jgi:hypothetical protein